MEFDVLSQYANGLVRRIVRSALTPALWLCFFAPVCWGTAYFFSFRPALEALCIPLGLLGFALVLPAIWGFVYFALKKPDKLRPEEYQLRQQVLAIIKRSAPEKIVDPGAISGIMRPLVSPEPKDEP
jgi:hypothetical protein